MTSDPVERLLSSLDRPLSPRPEFAEGLLDRLLSELESERDADLPSMPDTEDLMLDPIALRPTTLVPAAPLPDVHLPAPRRGVRRDRVLTHVATAALVILTLGASVLAFGPGRSELGRFFGFDPGWPAQTQGPTIIPALSATPATSSPEFLWESDGGPDPLDLPYGMDVDPAGNLWVSDSENDRFQIIAPDGTYRETWGASGSGDGEFDFLAEASAFDRPYGDIAFDADGTFYVADTGNTRIQKFAPDRTFLGSWGSEGQGEGQFLAPISLTVSDAGVVYVCDEVRNDVQMFDRDGQYRGAFGGTGPAEGQLLTPSGVAIDPAGDVWVADWGNDRMQRFSADGEWRAAWGETGGDEGQLDGPNDVVIDDQGLLYVADALNNRLQVFTPEGEVLAATGTFGADAGQFHYALGLALDENGVVYVSDRQRVQAFRVQLPDDGDESMP